MFRMFAPEVRFSRRRKQSEFAALQADGYFFFPPFHSVTRCDWFLSKWLLILCWFQWSSVIGRSEHRGDGIHLSPALTSPSPPQTDVDVTNAQGPSCAGACGVRLFLIPSQPQRCAIAIFIMSDSSSRCSTFFCSFCTCSYFGLGI